MPLERNPQGFLPRNPNNSLHLCRTNTGDLSGVAVNVSKLRVNALTRQCRATLLVGTLAHGDIESVTVDNRVDIGSRVENGRVECPNLIPAQYVERVSAIVNGNSLFDILAETNAILSIGRESNLSTLADNLLGLSLVILPLIH